MNKEIRTTRDEFTNQEKHFRIIVPSYKLMGQGINSNIFKIV